MAIPLYLLIRNRDIPWSEWSDVEKVVLGVCLICFWDKGVVQRQEGDTVRDVMVADVKPGDRIRTSSGFERVVYVHPGGAAAPVRHITFTTASGATGSIGLTPSHLVYSTGGQPVQAALLTVGSVIAGVDGPATVTGITPFSTAVRSLITSNGELIVDGIRISSYAFSDRLHLLTQSVAWLDHLKPGLPNKLCTSANPAVSRWLLPLLFEDIRELKAAQKAQQPPGLRQRLKRALHDVRRDMGATVEEAAPRPLSASDVAKSSATKPL